MSRVRLCPCLLVLTVLAVGCRSHDPPAATTLRVMTWNIHHGRGVDGKVDLERIARVILSARADIVALQEVDLGTRRTDKRDLAAELAKLCRMHHAFGKNIDYQGGDYGNALLSRFPILISKNHHYHMLRRGEQRGLLRVRLRVKGRELRVWNTHIDYRRDDTERLSNVTEIHGILERMGPGPILLCGDFNDVPNSGTHKMVLEGFDDAWLEAGNGDGFTFPSNKPVRRIDYVFLRRGSALRVVEARVPQTQASDHAPLLVELSW